MKLWIARDKNGSLIAFYREPHKNTNGFHIKDRYSGEPVSWYSHNTNGEYLKLNSDLFPEVTFENSPQEVEIKLVEK